MYNKILGTFSTKVFSSAIGLLVIILSARYLGPVGRGEISLFIANLTLVQLFNEIIIGSAMVYLVPRHKTFHLIFISTIWSIISSLITTIIISLSALCPDYLIYDLFYLSVAYAIFTSSMKILQGKQKIKIYNSVNIIQSLILILSLSTYIFLLNIATVEIYINTLYFSYLIPMLISLLYSLKLVEDFNFKGVSKEFISILKIGFNAQISTFLTFLNNRLSYYVIAVLFIDKSSLGIFSLATSLIESVWLVSYSVSTIQYPLISASDNKDYNVMITINLSKITFWATILLILILLIIPESIYLLIFGNGFKGLKEILFILSPGIIILSVSKIYWNYFSGLGKFNINNIAGVLGLSCSVLLNYILIKNFGISGAAYCTTLAYMSSSIYLYYCFKNNAGKTSTQLIPSFADYKLLTKKFKE